MQRAIVLLLICLAFPQKAFTQQPPKTEEGCGSPTIEVGLDAQPFRIPVTEQSPFTKGTKCVYQLQSPTETIIEFTIKNLYIGPGGNCIENYINVSDTSSGIKNAKYHACGTKWPTYPFRSTNNMAFIEFQVQKEFKNSFVEGTLIAKPLMDPACGPLNLTLKDNSAILKIPAEGKTFTGATACFYAITGNDDKNLSFEITKLFLGNDGQCTEDFIKVSDSIETLEKSKYTYCGTKVPTTKFLSSKNQIFVAVSTVTNVQQTSIIATYSKVNFVSKLESSTMVVLLTLALVAMC